MMMRVASMGVTWMRLTLEVIRVHDTVRAGAGAPVSGVLVSSPATTH